MPDYLFNPPPGWPPPPAPDWTPPDGWVPDPSWPPAPQGWQWWLPALEVTAIVPPPPNVEEAEAQTVGATRERLEDLAGRLEVSKLERTARFEASQAARHDRTVERKQKTEDDRAARKARHAKPAGDAQLTATVQQSTTPGAEPEPAPSPQPADKQSWGERHAAKQFEEDRAKALAVWQKDQDTLVRVALLADAIAAGRSANCSLMLKSGEQAIWAGPSKLVEPRRGPGHYRGASQGVSFKVAKGVRYRVGATRGTFIQGDEEQTVVDAGTTTITTQRVVFAGTKATREWLATKIIDQESSTDRTLFLLHVSNRQKVSGISSGVAGFADAMALAIAIYQEDAASIATQVHQELTQHQADMP